MLSQSKFVASRKNIVKIIKRDSERTAARWK